MTSPPLDCTYGKTTSGVACHHSPWTTHTFGRHRAWHAIIAFGLADTVVLRQAWHAIIALGRQTWSNNVRRGIPSLPLGSIDGRMASGIACHHRLWPAHIVERRRAWYSIIAFGLADTVVLRLAWHAIIALGRQTWSNNVRRGMPSLPLGSIDGRASHALIAL